MTIYSLNDDPMQFPSPDEADADGLLAVGGEISVPRLVAAYAQGIFPWYGPGSPILWWSPDPRLVLFFDEMHVPRRLERSLRGRPFRITIDLAFEHVIRACAATPRPQGKGTWLVDEMIDGYVELHRRGFAHSVEAWEGDTLAGGVYGVALGKAFFGESMFYHVPNASKAALVALVRGFLAPRGFLFMDCQQTTPHMLRFGAREVARAAFMELLEQALGL
ncbi:MAG: leucyl/phenylalanyl-tRNA--protein transferase [Desulfovibrionaceae bacterium]